MNRYALTYTQCNLVSVKTSPHPLPDAFRPPPNYCAVLNHPTLTMGAGFAENLAQEVSYLRHLRANTLEQVRTIVHEMGVCVVPLCCNARCFLMVIVLKLVYSLVCTVR